MTPRTIYYINYLDPTTGFLKQEQFDHHRDIDPRIQKLKAKGVKHFTRGHFERE